MISAYRAGCAALLAALSCLPPARADSSLDNQLHAVIADGGALAERRQQLEVTQRSLLSEKQALDAFGDDIGRRQTVMNSQVDTHNQQVSTQQDALRLSRKDCNRDSVSDSGNNEAGAFGMPQGTHSGDANKINACNAKIVMLNKKTEDVDQANLAMQQKQDGLELDYTVYNLEVADWNYREASTVTDLNMIYQATNAWLDDSYAVLVSDGFQQSVQASGNGRYCSGDALPSGHVTQQQLARGADYLLACFRRVARARQQPGAK